MRPVSPQAPGEPKPRRRPSNSRSGSEGGGGGGSKGGNGRRRLRALSGPAYFLFSVAAALLFLAALEGGLRLFHAAAPEPLLLRVRSGPLDVYQINPHIGRRYFPAEMERIMPAPGFRVFPARKEPGTVRIFVLGESSAAGFPYHTNGAFSGYMEDRLPLLLPGRRFEVVNCALTAINSYAALDFIRELKGCQPDLFVLYLGHNEYYGALGPASRTALGGLGNAPAFRRLARLRVIRLAESALARLRRPPEGVKGKTVMEVMTGQTGIRPGDACDRAACRGLAENLRKILHEAGAVPVILCEQASNLRDLPPFESTHRPGLSEEARVLFRRRLDDFRGTDGKDGTDGMAGRADSAGLGELNALVLEDSTYAEARFLRGRALLSAGRIPEARREFLAAREWDGIPFRAGERINAVIRSAATERGALLVPVEAAFAGQAAAGIPGDDLFFEHVHPRPQGQELIATTILRALCDHDLLAPRGEWNWSGDLPSAERARAAALTPLDDEIADQRIFRLTHQWPFPEDARARYTSSRDPLLVGVAQGLLDHKWDLVAAHLRLMQSYQQAGNLPAAEPELAAACKIFPVVPERFAAWARMLSGLGRNREALEAIDRALALDPRNGDALKLREQIRSTTAGGNTRSGGG